MKITVWCRHLLDNFFPNISGIWADYTDTHHIQILGIVRASLEYGFFSAREAVSMLKSLSSVAKNLIKLKEGWVDRLSKNKKITNTFQANNVNFHINKCKEHIACIIIQILTLSQDEYLINKMQEIKSMGDGASLIQKLDE